MIERLENRVLLYALSGSRWASTNLSVSYCPDGTDLGNGYTSSLFARFDSMFPRATWQGEFNRALHTWSSYTPLNFTYVSDDGEPEGTTGLAQGDPRFGDIRIGARATTALGYTFYPSTTTRGGDITLSTSYEFHIGSIYDLYSLCLHETGHALGLDHSTDPTAVMSTSSTQVFSGLTLDDIAGIQAIYGPRAEPVPPAAPSSVRATLAGDRKHSAISITWTDNSDNEDQFFIERYDGHSWARVATLPANSKTWTDSSVTRGSTYSYRIAASNVAGASAWAMSGTIRV